MEYKNNLGIEQKVITDFKKRMEKLKIEREESEIKGVAALHRLFELAQSDTGQCRVVAKFLLGCYNGDRFKFDLTEFRRLDKSLFDDCLAVLKMDWSPKQEVHLYFKNGGEKFENLAKLWSIESND